MVLTIFGKKKEDKPQITGPSGPAQTTGQPVTPEMAQYESASTPQGPLQVYPGSTGPPDYSNSYNRQAAPTPPPFTQAPFPAARGATLAYVPTRQPQSKAVQLEDFSDAPDPLNQLLQALLQDVSPGQYSADSGFGERLNDAQWVPPQATPPSRPMVLVSGDKGGKVLQPFSSQDQPPLSPPGSALGQSTSASPLRGPGMQVPIPPPSMTEVQSAPQLSTPPPSSTAKTPVTPTMSTPGPMPKTGIVRGPGMSLPTSQYAPSPPPSSPYRSVSPEKVQPKPLQGHPLPSAPPISPYRGTSGEDPGVRSSQIMPSPTSSPSRAPIGFEHVFDVTQGAFLTPGLVLISGPKDAGKTSLCISLTDALLKRGSPCLYVDYDQPPGTLRDTMKALGCDPAPSESSFRLLVLDGFSAQSDSFSLEPYYVEKPFDLDNAQEVIARNTGTFMGERAAIIFDSLDPVVGKGSESDLVGKLKAMADKMRELGAILVVTVTSDALPKDLAGLLEDAADCVLGLEKSGSGGRLNVRKLKGAMSKAAPEDFEIDAGKGLVFV